jgi:protein O-mannosyl-transferase
MFFQVAQLLQDGYGNTVVRVGLMKRKRSSKSENPVIAKPRSLREPGRKATPWWAHAAVLLALLVANLALYRGTIGLGFLNVDDPDYILNNPYVAQLSAANLKFILTTPYGANYAPANLLSYALDIALAKGKSATAIHLSNVLWHGFVAWAVYLLAFTIASRILPAAAAAGLFVLHPAHVEVVAWISSRKDLVGTSFAALAMAAYLLYRRRSRGGVWWYVGSVMAFLLASSGKQSVLLLPAVMLLWDVLVERRRNWQILADKVPFGLVTLFFGWMTWHAQPSTNQSLHPFVLAQTELTNLWLLTGLGQYVLYHPAPNPAAWSQVARYTIILSAVVVWPLPLLFVRARRPIHATLCYWVLIQMVPPMLLAFMVPITDRYLFLPSVGICLLLVEIAAGLERRLVAMRWLPWALVAVIGAVWGARTWDYIGEWRDPRSVWYGAHLKTPNSQVQQFLGEVYQNAGDRISSFLKSGTPLQLTNEVPFAQAVLGDKNAVERLRAEWTRAEPGRTNSVAYRDQLWAFAWKRFEESAARRGTLNAPNLFMCRGRLLVSEGKFAQAIPEFQNALALAQTSNYAAIRNESTTHALFAIGVAYWNLNNYTEAQAWLLKAQAAQRQSGHIWLPTLDQEVERIKRLAGGK